MRNMEEHAADPVTLEQALVLLTDQAALSEAHLTGALSVPLRLLLPGWRCSDAAAPNFDSATEELEAAVMALVLSGGPMQPRCMFVASTHPLCTSPRQSPTPPSAAVNIVEVHLSGAMSTGRWPRQAESPLARHCRLLLGRDAGLLGRIETLTLTGLCGTSPRTSPPSTFEGGCREMQRCGAMHVAGWPTHHTHNERRLIMHACMLRSLKRCLMYALPARLPAL